MTTQPTRARIDQAGDQVVDITIEHGYHPDSIVARADIPLRLILHRGDDDPCTERIVFSSPHLDRYLAPQSVTTIVLPPQAPGDVRFTCAMGRYRGEIELEQDGSPPPMRRDRTTPPREDSPVGMAIMLWVCSLPLVAIFSLVILGPGAAILAASLALPVWIAACWGFGKHRHRAIPRERLRG